MMITRGIPTPTRSDQEVLFTSNKFWQRAKFDIAEDFRVPRIVMSVLEDDLLPGDGYTPDAEFKMTELEKVTIAGKEELLLQVRMRKSDLTRGELELKLRSMKKTNS